jgi:alkaline phosphatase D
MVWLGDNVYYREPDFGSPAALRERNAKAREEPSLRKLLAGSSHYATWDDHDFGPNNALWTYRYAAAAEEVFKLYWSNPTYGLPGTRGVFGQFSWADVDFFLLDDRTYRTSENAVDANGRRMLGNEQMRWLKDALVHSEAPFKVVANGSQVLNARAEIDTLRRYPAEYRELMDWITANGISGVVFVTGDKHHAELIRETPRGFYTLYDFTSSPLTSGLWLDKGEKENAQRVPGTLVLDDANFGLMKFSGPCNDRVLTMETWDSKGSLRWTHTVRAKELVPPGTPPDRDTGHPGCRWLKTPAAN